MTKPQWSTGHFGFGIYADQSVFAIIAYHVGLRETRGVSANELYQKTRDDLLKRLLSNNENFDRSILTLSSAALALSVTYLKSNEPHHSFGVLMASWSGFVLSIIITILSYLFSQRGISRQLVLAERYYLNGDETALTEKNRAARLTDLCAMGAAFSFVAAIVLLLVYFSLNLPSVSKGQEMAHNPKLVTNAASIPTMVKLEAGASIPAMQPTAYLERGASIPPLQQQGVITQMSSQKTESSQSSAGK